MTTKELGCTPKEKPVDFKTFFVGVVAGWLALLITQVVVAIVVQILSK